MLPRQQKSMVKVLPMKSNDTLVEILAVKKKRFKYVVTTSLNNEEIVFSENQLVDNRIFPKQIFTLVEWQEILNKQNTSELFDRALTSLSYAVKTEKEMRDYLLKFTDSPADIELVIIKLKNARYIDDEKYASDYLNYAIRSQKGPKLIMQTLQQKGLEKDIIEQALITYKQDLINQNLMCLIEKELPKIHKYPTTIQKEKIFQKLLRLGYSTSNISAILNSFKLTSDHQETLYQETKKLLRQSNDLTKIKTKLRQKGYNLTEINQAIQTIQLEEVY